MGNQQKAIKLDIEEYEINTKRKNEIDKKLYKNLIIDKNFIEIALETNNKFRRKHIVEPLELDEYLNKRAIILAEELLKKNEFYNENLLYKNGEDLGMNVKLSNEKIKPEKLMEIWYEENKKYNYENPEEFECNNFTQMIWNNSTKFGIGYYHLKNKINNNENNSNKFEYCYIALYYPPGNIPGEYKDNVFMKYIQSNFKSNDNILNEFNIITQSNSFTEENLYDENKLYKNNE